MDEFGSKRNSPPPPPPHVTVVVGLCSHYPISPTDAAENLSTVFTWAMKRVIMRDDVTTPLQFDHVDDTYSSHLEYVIMLGRHSSLTMFDKTI